MVQINPGRMTAEIDGEFVVFLIGMRINNFWRVGSWLPVARAMGPMINELIQQPELGLLHARAHPGLRNFLVVQYWRSFEHLAAYARNASQKHLPAWRRFNAMAKGNPAVGIWHETYLISAGQYETIYRDMPSFGLGRAGNLVTAGGSRETARGRLSAAGGGQPTASSQ